MVGGIVGAVVVVVGSGRLVREAVMRAWISLSSLAEVSAWGSSALEITGVSSGDDWLACTSACSARRSNLPVFITK